MGFRGSSAGAGTENSREGEPEWREVVSVRSGVNRTYATYIWAQRLCRAQRKPRPWCGIRSLSRPRRRPRRRPRKGARYRSPVSADDL